MAIDLKLVKMAELKSAIKALNGSKLLEAPIKMVGKAADLAQKFVDGLAICDKAGKLDEVPDEAFDYYKKIIPAKGKTMDGADSTPAGTKAGTKATTKAATPAPPKPKKVTRAAVFSKVVKRGKFTKEQLIEKLTAEYGSNEKENKWWVGCYVSLLTELGAAEIDEKGRVIYGG